MAGTIGADRRQQPAQCQRPWSCLAGLLLLLTGVPAGGLLASAGGKAPGRVGQSALVWSACAGSGGTVRTTPQQFRAAVRRTRWLAQQNHLPLPGPVEVIGVPDRSAGLTFGATIRLQPAPLPRLLSTLFHEMGHLGPSRRREVEEAIADLTRRALVELFSVQEPGLASALLPALVTGLGPGSFEKSPPSGGRDPLSPSIYHEASRISLAFFLLSEEEQRGGPASTENPHALAARKIRNLNTSEVLRQVQRRLPDALFTEAAGRYLRNRVVPRLKKAAAASKDTLMVLLAAALEEQRPGAALKTYLSSALAGSETDRRNAFGILLELAPDMEEAFLDAWVEKARSAAQESSASVALTRRGGLRAAHGLKRAARADLSEVLFKTSDPLQAALALVAMAHLDGLGTREVLALLDMSPALSGCGLQGPLLRGQVLVRTGHPLAALPEFARWGARPGWSGVLSWARGLASMGHKSSAAALLRQQAGRLAAGRGGGAISGTLLLAGALLAGDNSVLDLQRAASQLSDGPGADLALAMAARRLTRSGHAGRASVLWRHVVHLSPASDLAVEGRQALRERLAAPPPAP